MPRRNNPITLARILLTLWLCSGAPAIHADDLALGMQALEMGHTAQAIELWRPLAEAGDVDAQFGLGVIYNDAMGVPQDYAEANYWFLRAAEQDYAPAQFNLGNAYKNGTGMALDPAMAVRWWRKAAEQGFMPAQFNLGSALLEGIGTPRDPAAGLEWYRRAAANGHPQAQHYLDTHVETRAGTQKGTQQGTQTDTARKPTPKTDADHRDTTQPATHAAESIPAQETPAVSAPITSTSTPSPTPSSSPLSTPTSTSVAADPNQPAECTAWLDRDSNTHTVQLMASQAEADARAYIAQHALTDTVICHYRVKGEFWYGLLYGRYDSLASARAALAALPAAVRAGGGYVRRIAEIRDAVNAR